MKSRLRREINRYRFKGKWIFSRTACLGNDAFNISEFQNLNRWNLQKGRVDVLINQIKKESLSLEPPSRNLFKHEENWKISSQLSSIEWMDLAPPNFVLMDSFSELTDQLFELGNQKFLAHYGDINWSEEITKEVQCEGLIPNDQIKEKYIEFFEEIMKMWGAQINCYFIHFPTKFESREELTVRGQLIIEAMGGIESIYPNVKNIYVPNSIVSLHENEILKENPFPYHFSHSTIAYISKRIEDYEKNN